MTSRHCCGRSSLRIHHHAIFHGTLDRIAQLLPAPLTQSTGRGEGRARSGGTRPQLLLRTANHIALTHTTPLGIAASHTPTSLAMVLCCKKGFPPPLPELMVTSKPSPISIMDITPRPLRNSGEAGLLRCLHTTHNNTPVRAEENIIKIGINVPMIAPATLVVISGSCVAGATTGGIRGTSHSNGTALNTHRTCNACMWTHTMGREIKIYNYKLSLLRVTLN